MDQFPVVPHNSIGPARLGSTREEIRRVLSSTSATQEPHERWGIKFPAKDYFFDNAFQVSYDEREIAEFIEVSSHQSFVATFDGIPVHSSSAETVLAAIRMHASPDETASEYPVNQCFPKLDLTIYREQSDDFIDAIGIGRRGYLRREG